MFIKAREYSVLLMKFCGSTEASPIRGFRDTGYLGKNYRDTGYLGEKLME